MTKNWKYPLIKKSYAKNLNIPMKYFQTCFIDNPQTRAHSVIITIFGALRKKRRKFISNKIFMNFFYIIVHVKSSEKMAKEYACIERKYRYIHSHTTLGGQMRA
jgi:hypothetical protein